MDHRETVLKLMEPYRSMADMFGINFEPYVDVFAAYLVAAEKEGYAKGYRDGYANAQGKEN